MELMSSIISLLLFGNVRNLNVYANNYTHTGTKSTRKLYYEELSKHMTTKLNKHIQIILKEMCKRVKAPYSKIDFKKDDWFMDYKWTEKQENDFAKWLMEYMKTNPEARRQLMRIDHKDWAGKFANDFIGNYGWSYFEK